MPLALRRGPALPSSTTTSPGLAPADLLGPPSVCGRRSCFFRADSHRRAGVGGPAPGPGVGGTEVVVAPEPGEAPVHPSVAEPAPLAGPRLDAFGVATPRIIVGVVQAPKATAVPCLSFRAQGAWAMGVRHRRCEAGREGRRADG